MTRTPEPDRSDEAAVRQPEPDESKGNAVRSTSTRTDV